jgi:hypothetical protein
MRSIRVAGVSLIAVAACSLGGLAQFAGATSARSTLQVEKAAAANVTSREANAMQAAAVAHGEANSALSNPFIEQKVTTPEFGGKDATRPPAGWF